jgi:hypothetical protein
MLAAYLAVWVATSAVPIGALGVLLTSYLVRGGWTRDLHESLSRMTFALPIAGVLFVPVLFGMSEVYPWAAGGAALPAFKAAYLVPIFFVARAVGCFAIWTALAVWARFAYGDRAAMERAASIGLIVWTLTISLAGIDWMESVEPAFHSSIYGLMMVSFSLVAAYAFALAARLASGAPRRMANTAYAGVLLSVLLLWAYLHAMQYIIVWTGNIPDEVTWYAARARGGWAVALWLLFVGQFIVPFFALLSERVRASTRALIWIAGATVALRYLEAAILVLPPFDLSGGMLALCIAAAALFVVASLMLASPIMNNWLEQRWLRAPATAR